MVISSQLIMLKAVRRVISAAECLSDSRGAVLACSIGLVSAHCASPALQFRSSMGVTWRLSKSSRKVGCSRQGVGVRRKAKQIRSEEMGMVGHCKSQDQRDKHNKDKKAFQIEFCSPKLARRR